MDGAASWLGALARIDNIGLVVFVLAIGAILLFARSRWARWWILGAALAFWFAGTPLGSSTLIAPSAHRFARIESASDAASAGAIVILGGGIDELVQGPDAIASPSRSTALRTLEGARLFRLLGERTLIVASGGRPYRRQRTSEGEVIADTLVSLRVPRDHVIVDGTSLTTHEQAVTVTRMLRDRGIRRFVLVTTPTHMWRSAAAFRAEHADVIPSVALAESESMDRWSWVVPNNESLRMSDQAVHDYLATAYYWARGWLRP